jgi:peptidoglycan LD-endopeptidase CwlK
MFRFSETSLGRLSGTNAHVKETMELAIALSSIDFGIPEYGGLRTADDQAALFTAGKSKCDGRINKSNHQGGDAADVYAYVDGKASWKKEHLALVAVYVLTAANYLGYKCEWGGTWVKKGRHYGWDMPHFNITTG